jgi:hypothetical protein
LDALVVEAAQVYHRWLKASEGGDQQEALRFFAEYNIARGKVKSPTWSIDFERLTLASPASECRFPVEP